LHATPGSRELTLIESASTKPVHSPVGGTEQWKQLLSAKCLSRICIGSKLVRDSTPACRGGAKAASNPQHHLVLHLGEHPHHTFDVGPLKGFARTDGGYPLMK